MHKFNTKDIIFIAILSAVLTLIGLIFMPLVMSYSLFGFRNMVSSFFYSIFIILGLMKIPKIGTLSLIGLFHGGVLLMIAPVMFWTMFVAGVIGDLIILITFKSYTADLSKLIISSMYIPMTFPMTLVFTMVIHGRSFDSILEKPLLSLIIFAVTIILSYLGTRVGYKLGSELRRAGKL